MFFLICQNQSIAPQPGRRALQGIEEIAPQSFDRQPVGAEARSRFLQRRLRDLRVDLVASSWAGSVPNLAK